MKKIRKLQMIQLDILLDVSEICKKNNLKYYLIAGTLLGAVRHKGFIPWDDDVDIAMYREDLIMLEEIIQNNYLDKYTVQNSWLDNTFTRFITKIRLKNTKMIELEEVHKNNDSNSGIWIDIFPIDYVDRTGFHLIFRNFKLRVITALMVSKHLNLDTRKTSKIKYLLYLVLKKITFLVRSDYLIKLFNKTCVQTEKENSPYSTIFMSDYGYKKETVLNEAYGVGKELVFENNKFMAPYNYEQILKSIYGDYMTLPPVEKRVSHHNIEQIDFGKY